MLLCYCDVNGVNGQVRWRLDRVGRYSLDLSAFDQDQSLSFKLLFFSNATLNLAANKSKLQSFQLISYNSPSLRFDQSLHVTLQLSYILASIGHHDSNLRKTDSSSLASLNSALTNPARDMGREGSQQFSSFISS